jgi:nitrogen fixation/metabolism regulation signal transduction histidine kinase
MQGSIEKQPEIKILPALSVKEKPGLREADIDDVVRSLHGVFPRHADEDLDVKITLVEKNLKIVPDMALMKEALTHLIRDAMTGCGGSSLTINQVNFETESLLNRDGSLIGAFAFIPLEALGKYVCIDEQIKEKIFEPFLNIKKEVNDLDIAIAYRIIKQQQEKIRAANRTRKGAEVNIYLPLTKLEIVNMMSIPAA